MKTKILIADDEKRMLILLKDFLERADYEVVTASNGEDAYYKFIYSKDIDLVILDVMMPLMNGLEVCEKIRETSNVPIIMLTAKTQEHDELSGFVKGADEYIKKPFSPSVLVARVNAILKRTTKKSMIYRDDALMIDFNMHQTTVNKKIVKLGKIEYKILNYFIDNRGAVLSREQILDEVWGYDYEGTDRTVDTHINRLRNKLLECGNYIQTVYGFGYVFEVSHDKD